MQNQTTLPMDDQATAPKVIAFEEIIDGVPLETCCKTSFGVERANPGQNDVSLGVWGIYTIPEIEAVLRDMKLVQAALDAAMSKDVTDDSEGAGNFDALFEDAAAGLTEFYPLLKVQVFVAGMKSLVREQFVASGNNQSDYVAIRDCLEKLLSDGAVMTSEQYVATRGCYCPNCGSEEMDNSSVQIDAGDAWQPMTCLECGATWNDVFKLIGYGELDA